MSRTWLASTIWTRQRPGPRWVRLSAILIAVRTDTGAHCIDWGLTGFSTRQAPRARVAQSLTAALGAQ